MGSGALSRRRIEPRDAAEDDLPVLAPFIEGLFERHEQAPRLSRVLLLLSQARDECDLIGDTPPALGDMLVRLSEVLALLLKVGHDGSYARLRVQSACVRGRAIRIMRASFLPVRRVVGRGLGPQTLDRGTGDARRA
jgi:hypothetical protein